MSAIRGNVAHNPRKVGALAAMEHAANVINPHALPGVHANITRARRDVATLIDKAETAAKLLSNFLEAGVVSEGYRPHLNELNVALTDVGEALPGFRPAAEPLLLREGMALRLKQPGELGESVFAEWFPRLGFGIWYLCDGWDSGCCAVRRTPDADRVQLINLPPHKLFDVPTDYEVRRNRELYIRELVAAASTGTPQDGDRAVSPGLWFGPDRAERLRNALAGLASFDHANAPKAAA